MALPAEPARGAGLLGVLRAAARTLQRAPRAAAFLVCVAWGVLIWNLSSKTPPEIVPKSPWSSVLTNLAHAPEFGLLTLWLVLAVPRSGGFPVLSRTVVIAILATVMGYAVIDEIHQSFTPGRDASVFDLLTDFVGSVVVLRLAVETSRQRTEPADVTRTFAFGITACILCAILASFVPPAFPDLGWL